MFKEGVRDILDRLDYDLVGLIPVKRRVREIAALLVLDKASSSGCSLLNLCSMEGKRATIFSATYVLSSKLPCSFDFHMLAVSRFIAM